MQCFKLNVNVTFRIYLHELKIQTIQMYLKLISSPFCTLSRVCLRLLFSSCKTSQNVAFRIYLHEVNSNFHVNRHFRREALCFIYPNISLDENLHSCKNQRSCWKKSLKGLKDKVCDS